jgi:peptidoglycan hydrolase FlgJ
MAAHIVQDAATLAATLPPAMVAKARKASQDFEAMAIGQMLKPMFDTLDQTGGEFGGGSAESTWRPMMVQEMAKNVAKAGGIGLSQPVFTAMLQMQESKLHPAQ